MQSHLGGKVVKLAGSRKAKQKFSQRELMEFWEDGLKEKFMSKIHLNKKTGCWLWKAGKIGTGYGACYVKGVQLLTHRLSYRVQNGNIPLKLELHHKCETRNCCNPDHLKPVTHRENLLLGRTTIASIGVSKTHCPQGHPYAPSSLIPRKPYRYCKICNLRRSKAHYLKIRTPAFLEIKRVKSRNYYIKNRQRILQRSRTWYILNRDRNLLQQKTQYNLNKERKNK